MKLIVLTQETVFQKEADALNMLFDKGLEILHLRKPFSEKKEIESLLHQIDPQYYGRIMLHDHFELVSSFPLKGIHLNKRNPENNSGESLTVSRSCHSIREVKESQEYNYVFLSPIFDSISKHGYTQAFSDAELQTAKKEKTINDRVIALGGISETTIPVAAGYGFGGVAVLGSLWKDFEKRKDSTVLLERFEQLKKLCGQI